MFLWPWLLLMLQLVSVGCESVQTQKDSGKINGWGAGTRISLHRWKTKQMRPWDSFIHGH